MKPSACILTPQYARWIHFPVIWTHMKEFTVKNTFQNDTSIIIHITEDMNSSGLSQSVMQNKALHITAGTGNLIMYMYLCYILDVDRLSVWMIIRADIQHFTDYRHLCFCRPIADKGHSFRDAQLSLWEMYNVAENGNISIGLPLLSTALA